MRNVLPIALLLALAACAAPTRWEKPGISDETKESDLTVCRRLAAREALTYYPSSVNGPLWPYQQSWAYLDTMSDSQRYYAEGRLAANCMRYKGYELVPAG